MVSSSLFASEVSRSNEVAAVVSHNIKARLAVACCLLQKTMTIPATKNGKNQDGEKAGKNEGTPLLSSFHRSASAVSGRSVRFDEDSQRSSESQRRRLLHPFRSASSYLEHFTQSERARALQQPGVGKAAFLIRDAIVGSTENPSEGAFNPYENPGSPLRNTISIICRRIGAKRSFRRCIYLVVWVLVALSFFEPPAWCFDIPGLEKSEEGKVNVGQCAAIMDLRGPPADDPKSDQEVQYYPNATVLLLTRRQAIIYESICLFLLGVYILMLIGRDGCHPGIYFRKSRALVPRLCTTLSTAALAVSLIIATCRQGYHTR